MVEGRKSKKQMPTPRYVLTTDEASVLSGFGEAGIADLPELAVSARLTPSEVHSVVTHLQQMHLAVATGNYDIIQLTEEGLKAQRSLVVRDAVHLKESASIAASVTGHDAGQVSESFKIEVRDGGHPDDIDRPHDTE